MSTLQHSDEVAAVAGGGGPLSSEANEIIGDNKKDKDERRESSVSQCSLEMVDLESVLHLDATVKDCRICQLSMDATNQDRGTLIELGCSCKNDLAAAHTQCAEAWFNIKGNKTCEICGSIAQNVAGVNEAELLEHWNEAYREAAATPPLSEPRNFWLGHRFLNFLLACMVFAFVISWLFHFSIPS